MLGPKSLIEGLAEAIPHIVRCYVNGVLDAWGPSHAERQADPIVAGSGSVFFAAAQIAEGHVILITALLAAIVAYLTRGRGALMQEIRASRRLGTKFADWVVSTETQT